MPGTCPPWLPAAPGVKGSHTEHGSPVPGCQAVVCSKQPRVLGPLNPPALMPLLTMRLRVFLPTWIILVPVSACSQQFEGDEGDDGE